MYIAPVLPLLLPLLLPCMTAVHYTNMYRFVCPFTSRHQVKSQIQSVYRYIQMCTGTYRCIQVHTGVYRYIQVDIETPVL